MKGLIIFFAGRPVTVIMTITAICLAAVLAFTVLPLDRLPDRVRGPNALPSAMLRKALRASAPMS